MYQKRANESNIIKLKFALFNKRAQPFSLNLTHELINLAYWVSNKPS